MKPCIKCGAALENKDEQCRECGATQLSGRTQAKNPLETDPVSERGPRAQEVSSSNIFLAFLADHGCLLVMTALFAAFGYHFFGPYGIAIVFVPIVFWLLSQTSS